MDIDPKRPRKSVEVVYRCALPSGLDIGDRRPGQPNSSADVGLVEVEPLSMLPHALPEPQIEF